MAFVDRTLTFEPNRIYYYDEIFDMDNEVMMDWETPIMQAKADYVCSNGGNILELGFGMGISATAIQGHNIESHTICEIHPQVLQKLNEWSKDKSNVTILDGDWFTNVHKMTKYDGILFDTHDDPNDKKFKDIIPLIANKGCKITWWNWWDNNTNQSNYYDIPNVTYDSLTVTPSQNNYFNSNTYYLPKCQL